MHAEREVWVARIQGGTATEAISKWLSGDYRCGDEPVMIDAIRRSLGNELSDVEIKQLIYEAWERGQSADDALQRLRRAGDGAAMSDASAGLSPSRSDGRAGGGR